MTALYEYIMKITVCYVVIYLFYFLLLKRITHYAVNRFFLLIFSVVVFIIPLIKLDLFVAPQTINGSAFINSIPSVAVNTPADTFITEDNSGNVVYIVPSLLIAGIVICLSYFLMQLFSFKKIRSAAQLVSEVDGVKLYQLDMDIIPFSFGNAIYLNSNHHSEDEISEIIKHESVHVRQKHTLDVLIAELVCILNWYNPFAWLLKNAMKQNLEFLADDGVIKDGTDKKNYQYLLLKVMGHSPLTIASSLNFSSLKKRIYMMNKTKTPGTHLLKFLFMLPVIALLMLAFRDTGNKGFVGEPGKVVVTEESFNLSQLTYSIADPRVAIIVKKEEEKSLLQVGKPFSITLIKNERDRLKTLLEKNGYNNLGSHSITFLIDSSLTNNNFSVQINIELQAKAAPISKIGNSINKNSEILFSDNKKVNAFSSCDSDISPSISQFDSQKLFQTSNCNTKSISVI